MRFGLLIPCYIDAFFPEVGIATLELPERFGHQVVYPAIKPAAASQWLIAASTRQGQPLRVNGSHSMQLMEILRNQS
jgi:hypothetical protein